jgi:hypothetical protein
MTSITNVQKWKLPIEAAKKLQRIRYQRQTTTPHQQQHHHHFNQSPSFSSDSEVNELQQLINHPWQSCLSSGISALLLDKVEIEWKM